MQKIHHRWPIFADGGTPPGVDGLWSVIKGHGHWVVGVEGPQGL